MMMSFFSHPSSSRSPSFSFLSSSVILFVVTLILSSFVVVSLSQVAGGSSRHPRHHHHYPPGSTPEDVADDGDFLPWTNNIVNIVNIINNNSSSHVISSSSLTSSSAAHPEWPTLTGLPPPSNISYLVNVTSDVPIEYAMVMFGYIFPILLVLTIVANSLVIVVLSQRHMITPTNLVLLAMAISDLLTLVFPAPWYFYMYTLNNHWSVLYPTTACYVYHLMIEVIPAIFHTASIWLTLLLAIQRYIYVCHITLARTWCTVPQVKHSMAIVFVLSFLHQTTRFFDRSFSDVHFDNLGKATWGCRFDTANWVKKYISENVYFPCYYGFRIVFVHVVPCIALVILNLFLFHALRVAQKRRDFLLRESSKSLEKESRKLRDSNSTTVMLIVVVTVFLSTEIPLAVISVLHVTQNALDLSIVDYDTLNTTILITNFLIMLSYPVNFAIYCGMSHQFRETFTNLFLKRLTGQTPSSSGPSGRHGIGGPSSAVDDFNSVSRKNTVAGNGGGGPVAEPSRIQVSVNGPTTSIETNL